MRPWSQSDPDGASNYVKAGWLHVSSSLLVTEKQHTCFFHRSTSLKSKPLATEDLVKLVFWFRMDHVKERAVVRRNEQAFCCKIVNSKGRILESYLLWVIVVKVVLFHWLCTHRGPEKDSFNHSLVGTRVMLQEAIIPVNLN